MARFQSLALSGQRGQRFGLMRTPKIGSLVAIRIRQTCRSQMEQKRHDESGRWFFHRHRFPVFRPYCSGGRPLEPASSAPGLVVKNNAILHGRRIRILLCAPGRRLCSHASGTPAVSPSRKGRRTASGSGRSAAHRLRRSRRRRTGGSSRGAAPGPGRKVRTPRSCPP